MRAIKLNLIILMVMVLITSLQTRASHIMGGEITYRWVTGNDYIVSLAIYRDCSGITLPDSVDIGVYSVSCQDSFIVSLPEIGFDILSPSCNNVVTTCYGGSGFGYDRHIYSDTVNLPSSCSDWKFVYASCCRNGTITNLNNGSSYGAYYYCSLDNLTIPFNNSPVFSADPIIFLSTAQAYTLNNGAYDPDGDSLVTTLSPALDGTIYSPSVQVLIPYNPGLSYTNPVIAVNGLIIDPFTGAISVTPTVSQVAVVVYQVEEYRNGILIGKTTRDLQVIIQGGSNQLPSLTGINGTSNYTVNVCYNDTLQFNINSFDLDVADSLTISWHAFSGSKNGGTNYSFVTAGIKLDSATFSFIPDSSMISSLPYFLYVSVKDNVCPYYGIQTYCYLIYVNSCSQDVWPGDANSDLQVNLIDLLPIGLAYNNTGPVRPGASQIWMAQPSPDWSGSFASGVNHKHADCNGDGVVNIADTIGISTNYGLTHPAKFVPGNPAVSTVADLYLIASPDTVSANNTVNVKICLGTSSVPVDSIYGISFRINFNSALIDTTSGDFSFTGSWMGTPGVDMLTFNRTNISNGFADVAMVRTDQTNVSGDSLIAIFSIVIVDNIAGKSGLPFSLSDVYAITYSEYVLSLNVLGDSVIISTTTAINQPTAMEDLVTVYPVPASNYLSINAGSEKINEIIIADFTGRKIIKLNEEYMNDTKIDLSNLNKGTYMISVRTSKGILNKRIMVTGK